MPASPLTILSGIRVLLVDDNEINRNVASGLLTRAGAIVEQAASGPQAILRMQAALPVIDAVLMDISMPGMDGYEATRLIRALPQGASVPIIAVSAHVQIDDVQACLDAGMNAHIAKPLALSTLMEVLRQQCAKSHCGDGTAANSRLADIDGFDLNEALSRLGDNAELYARSARLLRSVYGDLLASLATRFSSGGIAAVADLMHDLDGTASTLGARRLSTEARRLRQQMAGQDHFDPAGADAGHLAQTFDEACRVLEDMAGQLEAAGGSSSRLCALVTAQT